MLKIKLSVLAALIILPCVWGIRINEVMYNPPGDDNNQEFVEIIGTPTLSGFSIGDLSSNDSLELVNFISGNFSLIVEEGFNHSGINCSVYSAGTTIGNNLNNEADAIFLFYNGELVDFAGYDSSLANNNGYSLELVNNFWKESCKLGGSPGRENCAGATLNESLENESINQTIKNSINETNVLNKTVNNQTANNTQEENSTSAENESFSSNICFVKLSLSTDKDVYDNGESVKIINFITKDSVSNDSIDYIIEYWVEDLFGSEAKKRTNTTNTNTKTFTPSIDEADKVFIVRNKLVFVGCNNSNPELENQKMIAFRNPDANIENSEEESNPESSIYIDDVELPATRDLMFGEDFNVELSIHKGDTSKSVISVYAEKDEKKVSETTKFYLNRKDSDYNISIIVFLKPNCEEKYEDGTYSLVAEGLGERDEIEITIEGSKEGSCEEETAKQSTAKEKAAGEKSSSSGSSSGSSTSSLGKGSITSFYTRTKNYKENTTLYANIKSNNSCALGLLSITGRQNITLNSSGTLDFNVSAEPGLNLFALELICSGRLADIRALLLQLVGEEKKSSLDALASENKTSKDNTVKQTKEVKETNKTEASLSLPATGSVVYESDNMRIARKADRK